MPHLFNRLVLTLGPSRSGPRLARPSRSVLYRLRVKVGAMSVTDSSQLWFSVVPGLEESLDRVAMLAAAALCAPSASVMSADDQRNPFEQSLCAQVVGSDDKVIIGDTRHLSNANQASVIAWAGAPVRDQDGHVAGVLWVADRKPRQWNASDVAILEILADVASSDVILRGALARSAGRAALAQTLEESLLPPLLPGIPGLEVAARYAPAGTGTEVLADFCDV